jgi:hypothetical protein
MGTPLTGAENAEWVALLRDVPAARRAAFVALLSAAPLTAGQHAYTVTDITAMGSLDAVKRTIEAVPGFRVGDVEYFMQVYSAIQGAPDVDNQAALVTGLELAMAASAARGDSGAQRVAAIDKAVTEGMAKMDDIEGNSNFAYALLRLPEDSSKLAKVASMGTVLEELEHVFTERGIEITTQEWKKHFSSTQKRHLYWRAMKKNSRTYKRYGLVSRLTDVGDMMDEMEMGDPAFVELFFTRYMVKHRGRLAVADDSALYIQVYREWQAQGGVANPAPHAVTEVHGRGGTSALVPAVGTDTGPALAFVEQQLMQMKIAAQGLIGELQDAGRVALAAVANVADPVDPRPAYAPAGSLSTKPAVSAAHAVAQLRIAEIRAAKVALAKEKTAEAKEKAAVARAATAGNRLLADFKATEAAKAKAKAATAAGAAADATHAPEAVAMRKKIKALVVHPDKWATMTVAQRIEVEGKREVAKKVLRIFIANKNRKSDTAAPAAPKPADDAAGAFKVVESRGKKKAKRARTAETREGSPPPTPAPKPAPAPAPPTPAPPTPPPALEDVTEEML